MIDVDFVIRQSGGLFEKKSTLDSLHQEIADHFYPERADFTVKRHLGEEFAEHLMSGYPVQARRDLGDAFSSMLRRGQTWFDLRLTREEFETTATKQWLEYATGVMRRAMYDRAAKFVRATKEGDHDYSAFGQCVITLDLNRAEQTLLYRNWHLRDCAWAENSNGDIDTMYRKWKGTARGRKDKFKSLHPEVERMVATDPLKEVSCLHAMVPAGEGDKKYKSFYIDVDHKHSMEMVETDRFGYIVPRWSTVSGSQYAYSPAVVAALPDARLIQAITLTLLEAGEKYTNPPLLATAEAVRSDVNVMAGGITWVDSAYDERLGEVLRPISQDRGGFPMGFNIRDDVKFAIADAFYLNKLKLPPKGGMTAYEVSQHIQEYIRSALPLFEPMEMEYNGALCEETFDLLMANGAFGRDLPEELLGKEIRFQFDSPLQQTEGREQAERFREMLELMGVGAGADQTLPAHVDIHSAFRSALEGAGVPAMWMRDEDEAREVATRQQVAIEAQAANG